MIRLISKRHLAVLVILGILFSCINVSVYAQGEVLQLVQSQEQNRIKFNEMLLRNGIDPRMYEDLNITEMIIPDLELKDFPSFDEYLVQFERRLMVEGPMLLDRLRFEGFNKGNNPRPEVAIDEVAKPEVIKENVNRFIIKYKNSDSSYKVKNHFSSKIESTKKFDKETFNKDINKNTKKSNSKKSDIEVMKFN